MGYNVNFPGISTLCDLTYVNEINIYLFLEHLHACYIISAQI